MAWRRPELSRGRLSESERSGAVSCGIAHGGGLVTGATTVCGLRAGTGCITSCRGGAAIVLGNAPSSQWPSKLLSPARPLHSWYTSCSFSYHFHPAGDSRVLVCLEMIINILDKPFIHENEMDTVSDF